MVSNLKSETARANGAKSRGPTTPEGKEKSSRNSLKHGLTAGSGNILLDCEDPEEFEQAFNKLFGIHEPATPAEKDIVEEMVAARCSYGNRFVAALQYKNIAAVQFHPEKSGDAGARLLRNFLRIAA